MMGSFPYFIKEQQEYAARDKAPLGAIYKKGDEWSRIEEVTNQITQSYFKQRYHDCPKEWK